MLYINFDLVPAIHPNQQICTKSSKYLNAVYHHESFFILTKLDLFFYSSLPYNCLPVLTNIVFYSMFACLFCLYFSLQLSITSYSKNYHSTHTYKWFPSDTYTFLRHQSITSTPAYSLSHLYTFSYTYLVCTVQYHLTCTTFSHLHTSDSTPTLKSTLTKWRQRCGH